MGYLNPVLRFGMDNFCGQCTETGIDGVILPDLPLEVFNAEYSVLFTNHHLLNIFLISPHTSEERIKFIDNISRAFIYMVSSSSTTGIKNAFHDDQLSYFKRIKAMNLKNPKLIGFGISNSVTFKIACKMADGAIIGSAFVKMLGESGYNRTNIRRFVNEIRGVKQ